MWRHRYLYYANETRAEQDTEVVTQPKVGLVGLLWPSKKTQKVEPIVIRRESVTNGVDGQKEESVSPPARTTSISDEEWMNAERAVRQASGAACFYLITTDILGPFGLAYSFATVGWA